MSLKHIAGAAGVPVAKVAIIASASSHAPGKHAWTVLSILYEAGAEKPFISVVEGRVGKDAPEPMVDRVRVFRAGSLERALDCFDATALRQELAGLIPPDHARDYPDSSTARMRAAAARRAEQFYAGAPMLTAALAWLYPDLAAGSDNALAARFETDFGIASRTTRAILKDERDGKDGPGWIAAFVRALRFFDRAAWEKRIA